MPKLDSPDSRLKQWLKSARPARESIAGWNAEREPDLPEYFIDVGPVDELFRATEPCIVFARRGCGKTAQRKMLATQCRPLDRDGARLAVNCTVSDFERVLSEADGDVNQTHTIQHVSALLYSGLTTFMRNWC